MEMQTSDQIDELIGALAQAQGEFKPVSKSRENPFLKNRYATLDGVIDAIRGPLSKHGLAFVQPLTNVDGAFWLETRIMHSSGQWIASATEIPEWETKGVNALQAFGGALTYMRRYMLTSLLGINAEEDTDGDAGKGNGSTTTAKPKRKAAAKKTAEGDRLHWIDCVTEEGQPIRPRFWKWAKQDMGLNEDEVHTALGVKSVKDFAGTMQESMDKITKWQADQQALEAQHAEEVADA
jgi:hypothetical protein